MVTKKTSKKASKKAVKSTSSKKSSSTKSSTSGDGVICSVLQYFFPFGLIWYLLDDEMKKNKLVTFHLKQVLVLVIFYVALGIMLSIFSFLWVVGWAAYLILILFWVIGLIYASQGEEKELPLIGQFASHFGF